MENNEIAPDAINSSKRWLSSAKVNAEAGNYDSAIYSLEMSAEIALKAVLFAVHTDVPKTHSIGDVIRSVTTENKRVPKRFKEEQEIMISTLNELLELRSVSGYMFETKLTLQELKTKYDKYLDDVEKILDLCEKTVNVLLK